MVYKVSKCGVRSGNTLRNLRSRRTERYSRQACIVGRSNLNPIEVPTFLDSSTEDPMVSSTLGSTDVLLSLNKKGRWRLPATVSHMIKSGNFNKGNTMVSLLERHRLKRRANCVSFVCNQGRLRHVTPTQKRYFSFKLDNIDSNQSKRQIRKQKAEAIKQMKATKVKTLKEKQNNSVKTLEVYTVEGSGKGEDVMKRLVSSKPEYRLEVFYPCPQSCSLAYNPKYTNVHMEFAKEGGIEIQSEMKKTSKGRRHYRKRFSLKDLEAYEAEIDPSYQMEPWDDDADEEEKNEEDSDCGVASDAESTASFQEGDENITSSIVLVKNEDVEDEFDEEIPQVQENLISSLIAQAEKARSMCGKDKHPRRRKNSNKCSDDQPIVSDSSVKSHIVYTNDENPRLNRKKKQIPNAPISRTTKYVVLHSAKVILKSSEVTPGRLKAKFGHLHAEAESEPRRFIIDITEDIQNLLCTYRSSEKNSMYTSFLVFVYDGVYDEDLDTYKVTFNSSTCTETRGIGKGIPFEQTSVAEIVNRVVCVLLDMKEENLLVTNYTQPNEKSTVPILKFVNDLFNANVETFRTCDEIRRASERNVMQENVNFSVSLNSIVRNLDFEIFCDICYENINPTQTEALTGTELSRCGHTFCDECWRSHFRAKLKNGAIKIVCPGYACDVVVGPVTLLSLLHVSEVSQLFQRMSEHEAETSSNCKWCPNPDCGRVMRLEGEISTTELSHDVTCVCGHEFCFTCLSHPHWPATCEQADKYLEKLHTQNPLNNSTDTPTEVDAHSDSSSSLSRGNVEIMEVEGRICPSCSKFIDKNGGCQHMTCTCGHQFCWICLKNWLTHSMCVINASIVLEHTRIVKVRHLVIPAFFGQNTEAITNPKPNGSRQKGTMYQKALQQRLEAKDSKHQQQIKEMVKKIANISQKDLLLKKEILSICGIKVSDADKVNLTNSPLVPHVSKFLRSCREIKRALHHVAEFTYVLLQDTPDSVDRRRSLRLAEDLTSYCTFIKSILELGQNQDVGVAIKRLADIQMWAKRALTVLLSSVGKLKY